MQLVVSGRIVARRLVGWAVSCRAVPATLSCNDGSLDRRKQNDVVNIVYARARACVSVGASADGVLCVIVVPVVVLLFMCAGVCLCE